MKHGWTVAFIEASSLQNRAQIAALQHEASLQKCKSPSEIPANCCQYAEIAG
jgi:hypothetical protein